VRFLVLSLGSISTILLRNVKSTMAFVAPDPFHVSGNVTEDARVDLIVYEGVEIAGKMLTAAEVQAGVGPYVSNVSVCDQGCGNKIVPVGAIGWTKDQVCGRSPQPFVNGKQLPPLAGRNVFPYCKQ
jgi:hypothetical protein